MDILSYLSELIQSHKEIGIPGLGTFYKKKSPGRYDKETHSFLPPVTVLEFKSEVDEQSLLADFISKKKNITPESARDEINQFVIDIKQQLADHKHANLDPLGRLSFTDNNLVFVLDQHFNFGYEFYGLPKIKDDKLIAEESEEDIIPHIVVEEDEVGVEEDEEHKNTTPLYLKIILGILLLLIALAVTYFINPDLLNNFTKKSNIFLQDTLKNIQSKTPLKNTADSTVHLDSVKKDALKTSALDSVAKDSAKLALPLLTQQADTTYEVIGASVHSQREAKDFIDFAKRKWGVNAQVVSKKKGRKIKISIASFKDIKTAKAERNRLAEKLKIPGLYIYTNNQK